MDAKRLLRRSPRRHGHQH